MRKLVLLFTVADRDAFSIRRTPLEFVSPHSRATFFHSRSSLSTRVRPLFTRVRLFPLAFDLFPLAFVFFHSYSFLPTRVRLSPLATQTVGYVVYNDVVIGAIAVQWVRRWPGTYVRPRGVYSYTGVGVDDLGYERMLLQYGSSGNNISPTRNEYEWKKRNTSGEIRTRVERDLWRDEREWGETNSSGERRTRVVRSAWRKRPFRPPALSVVQERMPLLVTVKIIVWPL